MAIRQGIRLGMLAVAAFSLTLPVNQYIVAVFDPFSLLWRPQVCQTGQTAGACPAIASPLRYRRYFASPANVSAIDCSLSVKVAFCSGLKSANSSSSIASTR